MEYGLVDLQSGVLADPVEEGGDPGVAVGVAQLAARGGREGGHADRHVLAAAHGQVERAAGVALADAALVVGGVDADVRVDDAEDAAALLVAHDAAAGGEVDLRGGVLLLVRDLTPSGHGHALVGEAGGRVGARRKAVRADGLCTKKKF